MEFINGQPLMKDMMVNSKVDIGMALAHIFMQMEINILENGAMIDPTEKGL
jgi:hypothetical protein